MTTLLKVIDLRSDTVTKPSAEMIQAIASCSYGDDYYNEDRDTNDLEAYCCEFFGVEEAVFMVSGTMANQVAIRCLAAPGSQVICDKYSHIIYHCAQGAADLGKVFFNVIDTGTGILTPSDIRTALSSSFSAHTSNCPPLIWVENTVGYHGGRVYPIKQLEKLYQYSRKLGMKLHQDGARLLNACAAAKVPPKEYTQFADTTMFSFSKGLGAPFGSVLLGSKEALKKARMYRKWYGGGLHQSGVPAAACLYALKSNQHAASKDNMNAKLLEKVALANQNHVRIKDPTSTNILMLDFSNSPMLARDFIDLSQKEGILLFPWSSNCVRAVTHRDISQDDILYAGKVLNKILLPLSP